MESGEQNGAVPHLENALETDDRDEKNYHIRQALQYLGLRDISD